MVSVVATPLWVAYQRILFIPVQMNVRLHKKKIFSAFMKHLRRRVFEVIAGNLFSTYPVVFLTTTTILVSKGSLCNYSNIGVHLRQIMVFCLLTKGSWKANL